MADFVLNVKDLKTYYKTRHGEKIHAVDGVSLQLLEGQRVGIAGESGCGKSTLAVSLMGYFIPPLCLASGTIEVGGRETTTMDRETARKQILGTEISYIPQAAMNALNPTQQVGGFLMDVLREHRADLSKKDMKDLCKERFQKLGLDAKVLEAYPNELSGGMKQRTVVAISTILNPRILIADEPTSALDVTSQKKVIRLIDQLMNEGFVKSLIFITHELPLLYHITDEILVMYAGQIVEKGRKDDVVFDAQHPYSHALMNAIMVPEPGMKAQKLSAIPGAPPNLKYEIQGCRFADRCPHVEDRCRVAEIPVKDGRSEGRWYRCVR